MGEGCRRFCCTKVESLFLSSVAFVSLFLAPQPRMAARGHVIPYRAPRSCRQCGGLRRTFVGLFCTSTLVARLECGIGESRRLLFSPARSGCHISRPVPSNVHALLVFMGQTQPACFCRGGHCLSPRAWLLFPVSCVSLFLLCSPSNFLQQSAHARR